MSIDRHTRHATFKESSLLPTGVGPRNVGQISGEDYGDSNYLKTYLTVITQSFGANSVWTVGICILGFVLIFFHYIEFGLKKPSGPQNVGFGLFWCI